jgi:DNA-binding response OmpR family regulator
MSNILVVDDDKDILNVVEILLSMSGFKVVALARGQEVYDNIAQSKPDLILLDINLGDIDGRDICKKIKDNHDTEDIPIVMFSANHNMRNNLCPCNSDGFIEKPFDAEHLVETLRRLAN